jgi:hypothetical protein
VVTALDGTISASCTDPVVIDTDAVAPSRTAAGTFCRVTVTGYSITLLLVVLCSDTWVTSPWAVVLVAWKVTVAGWPTFTEAASASATFAVTVRVDRSASTMNPLVDEDDVPDEPLPDEPVPDDPVPDDPVPDDPVPDDPVPDDEEDAEPPPLTVCPTLPDTETTVPACGAASRVWSTTFCAWATATLALFSWAAAWARAAGVGVTSAVAANFCWASWFAAVATCCWACVIAC